MLEATNTEDKMSSTDHGRLARARDGISTRLTRAELTKAIQRFARRHGHYSTSVRNDTVLRAEAIREYVLKTRGETEWSKMWFNRVEA